MPDATTVQLLASALGGGIIVGTLNIGLRLFEFRRDDKARWATDKREAYAAYIKRIDQCLGEAAPLEAYLPVVAEHGNEESSPIDAVKRVGQEAYDAWLSSQPHRGTLRLLAGSSGIAELDVLEAALLPVLKTLTTASIFGSGLQPDRFPADRAKASDALERFVDVARKDIGAE